MKQAGLASHKVAKEVQKIDEVVEYPRRFSFLGDASLKQYVIPAESTRLVDVLKRWILCHPS